MSAEEDAKVTWCSRCNDLSPGGKYRKTCDYAQTKGACTKCVKDKYDKWCKVGVNHDILDKSARPNRGSKSTPQSNLPENEDEEDSPTSPLSPSIKLRSRTSSLSKVTKHQPKLTSHKRRKSKPTSLDLFMSKESARSPLTPSPTTQKYLTENVPDHDRPSDGDYDSSSSKLSSAPSTPRQQPIASPSLPPRSESHASTTSHDPTTSQTTPDDTGPSIEKANEIAWARTSRQDFCRWLIIGEWIRGHERPCYWPPCTEIEPHSARRLYFSEQVPAVGEHILDVHLSFYLALMGPLRPDQITQPAFQRFEGAFADVELIFASMKTEGLVTGEVWVDEKTSVVEGNRERLKNGLRDILTKAFETRSGRYP